MASEMLLDYAFGALPTNKIYLEVFTDNKKAIRLYEKLGFKQKGLLKEEIYKNGTFKDIIRMTILKKDWLKTK